MTRQPQTLNPATIEEVAQHCACFNLRRAARAITQHYDRALAPSGLRATQFTMLVALARAGTVPFTKLATVLGMDRTTLSRNVGPLERDGLLTMRAGPDRRVKLVAITEKGRKTLAGAIPRWEGVQRRLIESLGTGRWDGVRRDLRRITTLAGEAGAD